MATLITQNANYFLFRFRYFSFRFLTKWNRLWHEKELWLWCRYHLRLCFKNLPSSIVADIGFVSGLLFNNCSGTLDLLSLANILFKWHFVDFKVYYHPSLMHMHVLIQVTHVIQVVRPICNFKYTKTQKYTIV